jgi:hypothetical protein
MRPALLLSVGLAHLVACATPQPIEPRPAAELEPPTAEPRPAVAPGPSTVEPKESRGEAVAPVAAVTDPVPPPAAPESSGAPEPLDGASVIEELRDLGEAAATETDPKGGGSIRAKKEAELARRTRLGREANLQAKVEAVSRGRFPLVALRLRVTRPARMGAGAAVARGGILVVTPKVVIARGGVDLGDPATELNAGAYYLQRGDKVAVRLGEKHSRTWIADYVERK